jgi:hypothetical protein
VGVRRGQQRGPIVRAGQHADPVSRPRVPARLQVQPGVPHHGYAAHIPYTAPLHGLEDQVRGRPPFADVVAAHLRIEHPAPLHRAEHQRHDLAVEARGDRHADPRGAKAADHPGDTWKRELAGARQAGREPAAEDPIDIGHP